MAEDIPGRFKTVSVEKLEEEAATSAAEKEEAPAFCARPEADDEADVASENESDTARAENRSESQKKDPAYSGTVDIFSTSQVGQDFAQRAQKAHEAQHKSTNGIDVLVADTFRNPQDSQLLGQSHYQPQMHQTAMNAQAQQLPQQFYAQQQYQGQVQYVQQQSAPLNAAPQMIAYPNQANAVYTPVSSEPSGDYSRKRSLTVIIGAVAACLIVVMGLGAFALSKGLFSHAESDEQVYLYNSAEMIDVGQDTIIKPYDNNDNPMVSYTATISPVDPGADTYTVHTLDIDGSGGFSLGQVPGITSDYYYIDIQEKGHSGGSQQIGPIRKGSIETIGGDDVLEVKCK